MKENRNSIRRWIDPAAATAAGLAALYLLARERRKCAPERELSYEPSLALDERSEVIDGIQMHWLEHGRDTRVVLIHGIPTSPWLWRKVIPRSRDAKVYAWEIGYGDSIGEGEGRDISVAQQADYLVSWMRHVGVGKAVLAGHGLGGGVVQIAAARHPELCSGFFLVNAICYDSWPIATVKAVRAMRQAVERCRTVSLGRCWECCCVAGTAIGSLLEIRPRCTCGTTGDRKQGGASLARSARLMWHFSPEDRPQEVADALNDLLREVEAEGARDVGAAA